MPRGVRMAQGLWVLGFGIGTVSHLVDLASAGTAVYAGFPAPVRAFWVALTLLDPAVIALVLRRQRAGVALGASVMVADVAVNGTMFATTGSLTALGMTTQTIFLLAVALTAPLLWRWFGSTTAAVGPTMQGTARPPTDS